MIFNVSKDRWTWIISWYLPKKVHFLVPTLISSTVWRIRKCKMSRNPVSTDCNSVQLSSVVWCWQSSSFSWVIDHYKYYYFTRWANNNDSFIDSLQFCSLFLRHPVQMFASSVIQRPSCWNILRLEMTGMKDFFEDHPSSTWLSSNFKEFQPKNIWIVYRDDKWHFYS